ncbi:MAG TPA: acetylxylan esterase [Terriglobia bacterium]|nr:acetylxylan esterase [Terriglobia bacterium]
MRGIRFNLSGGGSRTLRACACAVLALAAIAGGAGNLPAQSSLRDEHLKVLARGPLQKEYDDMLFKFLLREAERAASECRTRMDAVKSQADLVSWQEANRDAFLKLIGGLPAERTPLNARVVGEIARPGYVVRKVIFESLPEFYVTANLYVPTAGGGPYPAVLSPEGHSRNGKAYEVYQHLFIGLVKRGYVVLTYDPIGQGERLEYWDFLSGGRRFEFNQHAMAGIQEYLLGQNLARYFIWDGIRALDYLTSLPEVDASRIGITGSSGGGTLTTFISMLDPRVKVASIVTFITSLPKKIENRHNDAESDPEQDVQGLLAAGIDHPEYVGMIAPRPVQIGAATEDFFPIAGTRQTFQEARQLYERLGIGERIRMVEFEHRHMYSQPLREATTAWFDRWLKGGEGEVHEPAITPEPDSTLQCTPSGQVQTSMGGKRVYDFNRLEAERLEAGLEKRRLQPDFVRDLPSLIRGQLNLPSGQAKPQVRKLAEVEIDGLAVERLVLETEPGIIVPIRVIYSKNRSGRSPAVVYLRDRSGARDAPEIFERLSRGGKLVAVADVRGFGETMSPRNVREEGVDYFDPRDGMDADFAYAAFFLGRPLLGMRVWDALQVAEYLRSRPDVEPSRVTVAGRGWAGVIALFTAAVDLKVSGIVVEGVPASYAEVAHSELYNHPASLVLPGVLREFDLPDAFAALAPRPALVLDPVDALMRKMTREEARSAFQAARNTSAAHGAAAPLEVRVAAYESDAVESLERWLLEH